MTDSLFRIVPFLLAVLPALIVLVYFLVAVKVPLDYDNLWSAVGFGACAAFPCVVVELLIASYVEAPPGIYSQSTKEAFIETALPEETFKLLALLGVCWSSLGKMSGRQLFVCSIGCACGFAGLENLFYVFEDVTAQLDSNWFGVALMRSVSAVPGHAFVGAVMGYCVYRAVQSKDAGLFWWTGALAFPIVLHGAYDFFLFAIKHLQTSGVDQQSGASGVLIGAFNLVVIAESLIAHGLLYRVLTSDEVKVDRKLGTASAGILNKLSQHPALWAIIGCVCMLGSLFFMVGMLGASDTVKRTFTMGYAAFFFLHCMAFVGLAFALRKRRHSISFGS